MEHTIAAILVEQIKQRHPRVMAVIEPAKHGVNTLKIEVYKYFVGYDRITVRLGENCCGYEFYAYVSNRHGQIAPEVKALRAKISRLLIYYYSDPEFPDNLLDQIDLALSWPSQ